MAIQIYDRASKRENRLVDRYGRVARKLRISVTDRCNMQCVYCMPRGNDKWFEDKDVLTFPQITRLGQIFAGLGIENIRITGGEPTLRKDIEKLVGGLSKISRIQRPFAFKQGQPAQGRRAWRSKHQPRYVQARQVQGDDRPAAPGESKRVD
jgi:hypothetical protein